MSDVVEKFELKPGAIIVVPAGSLSYQKSKAKNREAHPETPEIVELDEHDDGIFSFKPSSDKGGGRFHLFVPGRLSAGDRLIVKWVEPNCACAHAENLGVH